MKSNVEDKLKDKIEEEDKEKVLEAVKEALEWMEENSDAGECQAFLLDSLKSVHYALILSKSSGLCPSQRLMSTRTSSRRLRMSATPLYQLPTGSLEAREAPLMRTWVTMMSCNKCGGIRNLLDGTCGLNGEIEQVDILI